MSGCASMSRRRGPAGWDARTSRSLTPRGHERAARARDDVRTRERVRARDPVVILLALHVCARSGATRAAMPLVARHPHTRGRSVETVSRRVRGSRALAVDVGGFTETMTTPPTRVTRPPPTNPRRKTSPPSTRTRRRPSTATTCRRPSPKNAADPPSADA